MYGLSVIYNTDASDLYIISKFTKGISHNFYLLTV